MPRAPRILAATAEHITDHRMRQASITKQRWMRQNSHIADHGVHKNAHKSGNAHGSRDGSPDALQWHTVTRQDGRVFCGTATSPTCHGTWPFVVVACVVSGSVKFVDTFAWTALVRSICSSLLFSARNSRRQLEVDLSTAHTTNGKKIHSIAKISVTSTARALKIPNSDVILPRSSSRLCDNGVLLPRVSLMVWPQISTRRVLL
jgi:hypothetical protein